MGGTGIDGVEAADGGVGTGSASSNLVERKRKARETRRMENLIGAATITPLGNFETGNQMLPDIFRTAQSRRTAGLTSLYQRIKLRVMRTTVTIDDDVFEAVKAQAQASGKRLGEVLSQIARAGLRASGGTASVNGLPVFKVPPGSEVIPTSRAAKLLAEERQ
jgi:hypothetical protein